MQVGTVQGGPVPEDAWFFVEGGQPVGPMPQATLQSLAASGRVGRGTLVWTVGMAQWTPAGSLEAMLPHLAATPTLPTPVPPTTPGPMMRPVATPDDTDATMRMLIPVGRSPFAIVAGYLGLFSVLLVPAPLAVLFAVLAIRDIRSKPSSHGLGRAYFGLVMGVLGTLVLGIIIIGSVMQ